MNFIVYLIVDFIFEFLSESLPAINVDFDSASLSARATIGMCVPAISAITVAAQSII